MNKVYAVICGAKKESGDLYAIFDSEEKAIKFCTTLPCYYSGAWEKLGNNYWSNHNHFVMIKKLEVL